MSQSQTQQPQETTFLNDQGVRVTNTRFILPKQTFAMSGITSVANHKETPSRLLPMLLIGLGGLGFAMEIVGGGIHTDSLSIEALLVILGGGWIALQKPTYNVLLHTSSGEAKALSSRDGEWIGRVVHAINEAMIHRG